MDTQDGVIQPINDHLRAHASRQVDWNHHELVQQLYIWADRFSREFFDNALQTPALQVERIRARAIGTYRAGKNGFGLDYEITLNTRYLDLPFAHTLETLLHEQIHQWQHIFGVPGRWNYHNLEFRRKALSLGMRVSDRGYHLGLEPGLFTELLAKHGIDATSLLYVGDENLHIDDGNGVRKPAGMSKLKKWSCGCTNVRAAVEVHARCLSCDNLFRPAEPAW